MKGNANCCISMNLGSVPIYQCSMAGAHLDKHAPSNRGHMGSGSTSLEPCVTMAI